MKPPEDSSSKQPNLDMETEGFGEHSIQNLNVKSVTNTFPLNLGHIKEKEPGMEEINEANQEGKHSKDLGNVNHANNSTGKETYASQIILKVNEPHVIITSTTRAPNSPNNESHKAQTNLNNVSTIYQEPIPITNPQTATWKRLPRPSHIHNPSQDSPLRKKRHSCPAYDQSEGPSKHRLTSQDFNEIDDILVEAVEQPRQQP